MKRADLERHLRDHGCRFVGEGGRHAKWRGPSGRPSAIPRHREIKPGGLLLFAYGFAASFQPDPHFGRILAAYGGVFVPGSLAWGGVFDGFRPDRWDLTGSAICLVGVAVIMYAPR